jgi:hypothetical protein
MGTRSHPEITPVLFAHRSAFGGEASSGRVGCRTAGCSGKPISRVFSDVRGYRWVLLCMILGFCLGFRVLCRRGWAAHAA